MQPGKHIGADPVGVDAVINAVAQDVSPVAQGRKNDGLHTVKWGHSGYNRRRAGDHDPGADNPEHVYLVGVGIGAIIHNWIPEEWIEMVLGSNNPFGVVLATALGVPMYADIFGTIPVAEALLGKGAQLGTVLSFMMAVTTLSLPSMIMLRKAVKPKLLGVFIAICVIGIIIVGYGFNIFQFLFI